MSLVIIRVILIFQLLLQADSSLCFFNGTKGISHLYRYACSIGFVRLLGTFYYMTTLILIILLLYTRFSAISAYMLNVFNRKCPVCKLKLFSSRISNMSTSIITLNELFTWICSSIALFFSLIQRISLMLSHLSYFLTLFSSGYRYFTQIISLKHSVHQLW